MTTERPYQKTKSFQEGIEELRRCSGIQFDPELVGYFIRYIEKKMAFDTSHLPEVKESI
jgi:HD-GYP domain-containing protein (c-di-GMP phosphodiesterase class II)